MKKFFNLALAWLVVIFALVPLIVLAVAVGALPFPRRKRPLLFIRRR